MIKMLWMMWLAEQIQGRGRRRLENAWRQALYAWFLSKPMSNEALSETLNWGRS